MKLLNSPLLWILISVVVIATLITVLILRQRPGSNWGFKDVVKNPKLWRKVEQAYLSDERAAEKAQKWDETQIATAVNHFMFGVTSSGEAPGLAHILKSLGPRVYPTVLQILEDASRHEKLVVPTGKNPLPEAPFNRACTLLGHTPPLEAAVLIAPFLDQPATEIRKDAALVLGKIGTVEVVAPLRRAFADSNEHVRTYALMGMEWAIKQKRLTQECGRGLYENIEQLVIVGKNTDHSASMLMHIDQARATELFLSERLFNSEARSIYDTLKALADKQIAVPRDRLLALIADLEMGEMKYPRPYALGEALRLIGQHQLPGDRPFLEARTTSVERSVAEGAAQALIASFGLEGFEERMWDAARAGGFTRLTQPQQYYLAVLVLDGQVNNGGLSQYFFNSSGDHWPEALAGLQATGFVERLAVLREAVGRFRKDRPSQDRERRQEQLARLERKNEDVFGGLNERYYQSTESVDVLLKRYVLKNGEAFK